MAEVTQPATPLNVGLKSITNFNYPSVDNVSKLKQGDMVKVSAAREHFWCEIVDVNEDGSFVGRVNNDLVRSDVHGLYCDDLISIQPKHIEDILYNNEIENN